MPPHSLLISLLTTLLTPFALRASSVLDTNILSGSADMYYRYDLARTDKNELTSFTRSNNQFSIGMAGIRFEHKTARIDMVADLGLGPRQQ